MIKEFRKSYGMTQKELSRLSGIARSTISDIERGKSSYKKEQLMRFICLYRAQKRPTTEYIVSYLRRRENRENIFSRFWRWLRK